jgi:hypothetical protein
MTDKPFYAKGAKVLKRHEKDGDATILGFTVLKVNESILFADKIAQMIADLMNENPNWSKGKPK